MTDPQPQIRFVHVPARGRAPGYSHLAEVRGGRTVYVSGQIAVNEHGVTVGVGDFTTQTRRVFQTIGLALAQVGLTFGAVVKLTFFLTDFAHLEAMRAVRDECVNTAAPPASSAVQVTALVRPELLIEVEAVAVAP